MKKSCNPISMFKNFFTGLSPQDTAITIIRMIFGLLVAFMFGFGKLIGGPSMWEMYGSSMSYLGINFAFVVRGLLAGLAEFGGGLALAIGYKTKYAAAAILAVMIVATIAHLSASEGMLADMAPTMSIAFGVVALIFVVIGGRGGSCDTKGCSL